MLRFTTPAICCALALDVRLQKDSAQPASSASDVMVSAKIEGPSVTVETTRGGAAVLQSPKRVTVYDFDMLDTLSKLGVPTGMFVDKNLLPYLDVYFKQTKPMGTPFELDYEALNTYKPQLVVIGSYMAKVFNQLSRIVPTIGITAGTTHLKDSAKGHTDALAQIFDKQTEANKLRAEIDASFEAAKVAAPGKSKGLVILTNGGKTSVFDTGLRLGGQLHQNIGMPAIGSSIREKGNHGQPVTFEYIKKTNPNQLFVLDRSAATGEEGKAAKDVLGNPLMAETTAWRKGQVVYLLSETYPAVGGTRELLNTFKQVAETFSAIK